MNTLDVNVFALLQQPHVHPEKDVDVLKKDLQGGSTDEVSLDNREAGWERTSRPGASAANNHRL